MKTKLTILLVALVVLISAGCGSKKNVAINKASDLAGKVIGAMPSTASPEIYLQQVKELIGSDPKQVIMFNRMSDIIAAITTGKIDATSVLNVVADYQVKRNSNLKVVDALAKKDLNIVMVVRSEDSLLKADINNAIASLKENGTLKTLEDKWVKNLPVGNEPANSDLEKIEGGKIVYVGVSGDWAPLDYIAANGRPAGYNVAILSEIGKLLKVNFEFVSIETQAKYTALASKKIDLIFYQVSTIKVRKNTDSWVCTQPYFTAEGGYLLVRK